MQACLPRKLHILFYKRNNPSDTLKDQEIHQMIKLNNQFGNQKWPCWIGWVKNRLQEKFSFALSCSSDTNLYTRSVLLGHFWPQVNFLVSE